MNNNPIDFISDASTSDLYQCFLNHFPSKQLHNYLPLYVRHLEPVRKQVRKVLEIGVEAGTSLRMWRDYFPNAEIIGFDINEQCKQHEEERIRVVIGDQRKKSDLDNLPNDIDVIIDDGIHVQEIQIGNFTQLFRHKLSDRGIYVIEDCEKRPKTVSFFKELASYINWWPDTVPGSEWPRLNSLDQYIDMNDFSDDERYWIKHALGVSIYRHVVFVDKGRNPEDGEARFRLEKPELCSRVGATRRAFLS